jgi:hypothetical protein
MKRHFSLIQTSDHINLVLNLYLGNAYLHFSGEILVQPWVRALATNGIGHLMESVFHYECVNCCCCYHHCLRIDSILNFSNITSRFRNEAMSVIVDL